MSLHHLFDVLPHLASYPAIPATSKHATLKGRHAESPGHLPMCTLSDIAGLSCRHPISNQYANGALASLDCP